MPIVTRKQKVGNKELPVQMDLSVSQLTADEYKNWMYEHPEEAKKLDDVAAPAVVPTVVWRNGVAVQIVNNSQTVQNGVVQG